MTNNGVAGFLSSGDAAFDIDSGRDVASSSASSSSQHFTIIFNTFVLMTLFNEVNARKIHGQRNVFEGLNRNPVFVGIWISTICAQVNFCPDCKIFIMNDNK
jgi:Ca2+ transporting ATPase